VRDIYRRKDDDGPGVPEAVPRVLQRILADVGARAIDRIWVFPPLVAGRSESGLLALSRFGTGDDPERRILSTFPYTAERTGKGLTIEGLLTEQGEAPLDRFPRVMEGVVARTEKDLGEPRQLEVDGDEARFLALLATFDPDLLDPTLPPVSQAEAGVDAVHGDGDAGPGRSAEALPPEVASAAFLEAPESEDTAPGDDELFDLYAPEATP